LSRHDHAKLSPIRLAGVILVHVVGLVAHVAVVAVVAGPSLDGGEARAGELGTVAASGLLHCVSWGFWRDLRRLLRLLRDDGC
jgi:hypothetical protein